MAAASEGYLVWGGGGHGKVVADLVRAVGGVVAGYVDADAARVGRVVEPGGARVLLSQEDLLRLVEGDRRLPEGARAVVLAIGANEARWRCYQALGDLAAEALVHPSAVVSPSARLGRATVVFPRAVINAAASVGAAAIINSGAIVEHDCVVGDGAHISPGAVLAGGVSVGARSWVGAGATVLPGVAIGSDSVIGAGSLVRRDVGDGLTAVGVPARAIRRRP